MPRAQRFDISNALYHIHAKAALGRTLFDDLEEGRSFVKLLRELSRRDGWTVMAWVLPPTSYQLAVRTGSAPLSRTMHSLQGRYAQGFNRRQNSWGFVWGGRYTAQWVDESRWLKELVLYLHALPVSVGLVEDPLVHLFSGHGELVGRDKNHVVEIEAALGCFGTEMDDAREAYSAALRRALCDGWCRRPHVKLPWWRAREPKVRVKSSERASASVQRVMDAACRILEVEPNEVRSRRRARGTVVCREIIATVGVESFGLRTREIAEEMRKNPDWVSCLCTRGSRRRIGDARFAKLCERVERAVRAEEAEPQIVAETAERDNVVSSGLTPRPTSKVTDDWAVW